VRRAPANPFRETGLKYIRQVGEETTSLQVKPTGKQCVGMEGCIKEAAEALETDGDEAVLDLGIIGAGSRVEHYEMAGYKTAITLAQRLGAMEVVDLLTQSLAEEQGAEQKLRKIAASLIKTAAAEA